jgi:hypothetical protein
MDTMQFVFENRRIKDPLQLHTYLKSMFSSFKHIQVFPNNQRLSIVATLDGFVSADDLEMALTHALNTYPDPPPIARGRIHTHDIIYTNFIASESSSVITIQDSLNLSGHRLVSIGTPIEATDGCNKAYVDAITAGSGLRKRISEPVFDVNLNSSLYVNSDNRIGISSSALSSGLSGGNGVPIQISPNQPQITTIGTLTSLNVSGNVDIAENVVVGGHITASNLGTIASKNAIDWKTDVINKPEAVGPYQPIHQVLLDLSHDVPAFHRDLKTHHIMPKVDDTFDIGSPENKWKTIYTGSLNATNVTLDGDAFVQSDKKLATEEWVIANLPNSPDLSVYQKMLTVGTGLALDRDTNVLSALAEQTQITSVGTLTGLTSSDIVDITDSTPSTSSTTGALRVVGGVGIQGSLFLGTDLRVDGTSIFSGTVSVPSPTDGTHVATKSYVDGASYLTAGTGLTRSGATLSVNANQTHITSVGTLSGLNSTGVINVTNTTASISTTTGALRVTGGVGIQGSLRVGGTSIFSGAVAIPNPTTGTHATTKTYVDGATYLTAGTGLTRTGATLSVNANQTQITSVGTLGNLEVAGHVSCRSADVHFLGGTSNDFTNLRIGNNVASTHGFVNMIMNSSTRTNDGGASTFTVRNDAGDVRIHSRGGRGFRIGQTSGDVTTDANVRIGGDAFSQSTKRLATEEYVNNALQVYQGTVVRMNVKIFNTVVTTFNGRVTVNATLNGNSTGVAIFSSIMNAWGSAVLNTSNAVDLPWCILNSVTNNNRTLTFSVITGAFTQGNQNHSVLYAPNGIPVAITAIGF